MKTFKVGMRVTGPRIHEAVVCQIDNGGNVYVMWGDNNRKRFTFAESQQFTAVGDREEA